MLVDIKNFASLTVNSTGNFLIDAPFGESYYRDPKELLMRIKMLTGVVEVGLFCGVSGVSLC